LQPVLAPRPRIDESIDPGSLSPSGPQRAWKQFGLVLLCGAWIALGLIGHDPWKTEDATTFSIATDMVQRHDIVAPILVGEPRFDHGVLVPAIAAGFERLLAPPLELHNAARLAVGVLLVLILLFASLAARELDGRAFRWLPVLILIGSVGFFDRAHALSGDLGVTLGTAIALYGFALALRTPIVGGLVIGLGAAAGFLARGYALPLWVAVTAIVLPLASSRWRTRAFAAAMGIAVAVTLVVGGTWPFAMYMRDATLFAHWRDAETAARYFAWLGPAADFDPTYALKNLPWFAWPALPLVVWVLWIRGRGFNGGLASPGVVLPAVFSVVILAGLLSLADPTLTSMLPLLVPLAVLAAVEIDTLSRSISGALDWFGILTFGLLATVLWFLWVDSLVNSMSPAVARFFRDTEFGYRPPFQPWAVLVAAFLTLLWIALVRPARKSNRRALLNWAAGIVLVWGLFSTIWMPYLDSRRSYRSMAVELAPHLPAKGCVAARNLGDAQRALLNYFTGLVTVPDGSAAAAKCDLLIVQYGRQYPDRLKDYHTLWEGQRRGDDTEHFALYAKDGT
jgi:4-amino-4-deoxy-L-arabinose transferase-like glycosyltransferase